MDVTGRVHPGARVNGQEYDYRMATSARLLLMQDEQRAGFRWYIRGERLFCAECVRAFDDAKSAAVAAAVEAYGR